MAERGGVGGVVEETEDWGVGDAGAEGDQGGRAVGGPEGRCGESWDEEVEEDEGEKNNRETGEATHLCKWKVQDGEWAIRKERGGG